MTEDHYHCNTCNIDTESAEEVCADCGNIMEWVEIEAEEDEEDEDQTTLEKLLEDLPSHVDEDAFTAFYENDESYNEGRDLDDLVESFEEAYAGRYTSDEDFAQQLSDDLGYEISDSWPG